MAEGKRARATSPQPNDNIVMFEEGRPEIFRPKLPSSPHPRRVETANMRKKKDLLVRMKEKLEAVAKPKTKKDSIPIRGIQDIEHERMQIKTILKSLPVTMTLGQLLDRSPQLRSQILFELGLQKVPGKRGRGFARKGSGKRIQSCVGKLQFVDNALPKPETVYLGYISATLNSRESPRILLDNGSIAELIGPRIVKELGLTPRKVERSIYLKIADDSITPVRHYVLVPAAMGPVKTYIRAYIVGHNDTYDMVFGRT